MTERIHSVKLGQRFGQGLVAERMVWIPRADRSPGEYGFRLRCDCGNLYEATLAQLFDGEVQSCGCVSLGAGSTFVATAAPRHTPRLPRRS